MATQKDSKQILVGAGEFFVGTASAAFPTASAGVSILGAGRNTPPAGYSPVGFTQEGVEVSYEPDYGDVEVDQLLDSARIFKQSMKVTVNTTLAQAVLENLVIVWGQKDTTLANDATETTTQVLTLSGGALGDAPVERSLLFVGPGPRYTSASVVKDKERIYHVGRAIQTESSSHALRRSEVTALPVSFRILPDDATGNYGTVRDRQI